MSYLESLDKARLNKEVVKEGDPSKPTAKRFDKVTLLFKLTTADGETIAEGTDEAKPFEVKVGDRDLLAGFNLALTTMREGEAARFSIPEDLCFAASDADMPDQGGKQVGPLTLDVTVISVEREAKITKWDLEDEEKLGFATQCKEEGNSLFKAGDLALAEEKYAQAVEIVEWDQSPRRRDLKVVALYNLAQTLAKQKKFVSAMEKINWAINLKPEQAKGYFRKAGVFLAMSEFDRALEELQKAKKIEPSNPEVASQISQVKEAKKKYHASSHEIFGKIFDKSVYEEKATCEYSDNLNPLVELDLAVGEDMVCCKIELFSNIMPDTCNYFESLVKAGLVGGYFSTEVKKNNFLLFDTAAPESEEFKDARPENKSNKVRQAGMVFFKPTGDTGEITFRSAIGISLAPLPWFDLKWIPFGFVCSPVDFQKKVEALLSKAEAAATDSKKPVTLLLKNCRMF